MTSTPRYKGLNNQLNQVLMLITLGALSNATVILPHIHSNFLPGKQNTMPPLCAINDDPADPVSYRSVDSPCSALVSFQLAYDVEQMRAALWEDVCVVSHEEHAVLCGTHQANLSANAKPWPICSAPGGQYLRSILFHSPVARSEIHQHIRTRVAGTLRLCIAGDCPASFGRLRFCKPQPAMLSSKSWAWYRTLRSRFAGSLRAGELVRPALSTVAAALMRHGALYGADYDALHLRTENDMAKFVRKLRKELPTAKHIGKWMTIVAKPFMANENSVRPLYIAHAGATIPPAEAAALVLAAGYNRTRLIGKADVFPPSVLQSFAAHRELLALLEQLVLMGAAGTFIGYSLSSLSSFTIEGRHPRGLHSLDYSTSGVAECCMTGLTDRQIVQVNSATVKPATQLVIAIWSNYVGDGAYGGSSIFLSALARAFERRMHTVIRVGEHPTERTLKQATHAKLHILNQNSFASNAFVKMIAVKPAALTGTVVMRSDGPFVLHRGSAEQDTKLLRFTSAHANLLVYQSEWSRRETERRGLDHALPIAVRRMVIGNAAEPAYFFPRRPSTGAAIGAATASAKRVVRIATSVYSTGERKNMALALEVAGRLDRERFQWLFIGRLPTSADWGQQIKRVGVWVDVVPQRELGVLLRERADLFFSPSWHECFSNSEVQALASGLPVVALNDSSHPEVVGTGGVLFSAGSSGRGSAAAAAHAIEYAAAHLEDMRRQIPQHSIDHVANEYIKLVTS